MFSWQNSEQQHGVPMLSVPRRELGQCCPKIPPDGSSLHLQTILGPPSSPKHKLLSPLQPPFSCCPSFSGPSQVRFKQAQTIQSLSFPWSSTRKDGSCYTSLGDEDPRQPNRQVMTKVKCKLRTQVSTEPEVGVLKEAPAAASQGCCWQVNSFSTHLGCSDASKNQEWFWVWVQGGEVKDKILPCLMC